MENCKIRAAAEREHDAPEIAAHAFRLVNTTVFSTSAFSIMLKKLMMLWVWGIIVKALLNKTCG